MSGEVHEAMLSRGFRGNVRTVQEFKMAPADWFWLAAFLSVAFAAMWAGR